MLSSYDKKEEDSNFERCAGEYQEKLRKYRQAENDMKAYNSSLQTQFRKQQEEVSKVELENYKLLEELQIQETMLNKQQKEQTAAQKTIDGQEQELQDLIEKIERETGTAKRIDDKVKNLQKEIIEQKRKQTAKMGGAVASNQDQSSQLSRQVKIIENRLEKANKRYSDAMNQNKVIRDKIDELRRERVVFEQVYVKLEKELGVKRRDLARMVESVDKINEDRDQAVAQIQAFQAANKAKFDEEDESRVEEIDDFDTQQSQMAKREIRKAQTPLQRLQNSLANSQGAILTNDEIIRRFVTQEEQHFELFNTVSSLKKEVNNYENEIFDTQGKLEKLGRATDISAEGPNSHKAKAMRELNENMNILEDDKARTESDIKLIESELAQIMQTIKDLGLITLELENELEQSWEIVKKSSSDIEELQDKQAVTQDNVSAFMQAIEVKVAELLIETGNQFTPQSFAQNAAQSPQLDFTKMPQMSEQEFTEDMRGEDGEEDVMFMSMQDFKKKLDMMSMQQ